MFRRKVVAGKCPAQRFLFWVKKSDCIGTGCLLCETPELVPGLITRYSGYGLVTSRYFDESSCKARISTAIAVCPGKAIAMEEVR